MGAANALRRSDDWPEFFGYHKPAARRKFVAWEISRNHSLVVFREPRTEPLLGAFTLEGFGLAADPVNRRLFPVPALLKLAG